MVRVVIIAGDQAEAILQEGRADLIAVGRELMYDPYWTLKAAESLGCDPGNKMWPDNYGKQVPNRRIRSEDLRSRKGSEIGRASCRERVCLYV